MLKIFFIIHVCMYFYDPHSRHFQKPKIKTLLSGDLRLELSLGGKLFKWCILPIILWPTRMTDVCIYAYL